MANRPCARSTSGFKFNASIAKNPLIPFFSFNPFGSAPYSCGLNSKGDMDAHAMRQHSATATKPPVAVDA